MHRPICHPIKLYACNVNVTDDRNLLHRHGEWGCLTHAMSRQVKRTSPLLQGLCRPLYHRSLAGHWLDCDEWSHQFCTDEFSNPNIIRPKGGPKECPKANMKVCQLPFYSWGETPPCYVPVQLLIEEYVNDADERRNDAVLIDNKRHSHSKQAFIHISGLEPKSQCCHGNGQITWSLPLFRQRL